MCSFVISVSSELRSAIAIALHVWYYSEFAKITVAILEKAIHCDTKHARKCNWE